MLEEFDKNDDRQCDTRSHEQHCHKQKEPITGSLARRAIQVALQQLIVAAIGFEGNIEEIANERDRACQAFDCDVYEHASDGNARDAELDGAAHDIDRNQCVDEVADAGNDSYDASKSKPETSGQLKSVIKPACQRLYIRDAGIDHFGRENAIAIAYRNLRCSRVRHGMSLKMGLQHCSEGFPITAAPVGATCRSSKIHLIGHTSSDGLIRLQKEALSNA